MQRAARGQMLTTVIVSSHPHPHPPPSSRVDTRSQTKMTSSHIQTCRAAQPPADSPICRLKPSATEAPPQADAWGGGA